MASTRLVLICFLIAAVCGGAFSRHLRHHNAASSSRSTEETETRRSLRPDSYASNNSELDPNDRLPYSYKRLDKMMKKAILQIIMGELRPADMLLLKALNYTPQEVMEIREQELERIRLEQQLQQHQAQTEFGQSSTGATDSESSVGYDAYNRQAVYDYENGDPATSSSSDTTDSLRQAIDRAMEPHVVFKVRYDDSEIDSRSEERLKLALGSHRGNFETRRSQSSGADGSFHDRGTDDRDVDTAAAAATIDSDVRQRPSESLDHVVAISTETPKQGISEYEGLEWLGGDVYRVKPEAMEAILAYEDAVATEGDDDTRQEGETIEALFNDTGEYQSDAESPQPDFSGDASNGTDTGNLTAYERLAIAQRKDENETSAFGSQGQKAMEDIKLRVLALTGRFNLTSSNNQVQREKLTMFHPTCQMPRNTDGEAWSDPFSMNMHFQLNVTSGEHVLAAKLRLFKLPQDISTSPSSRTDEGEDEDEKKIRVSVYFYTKSLKKHRAKKRLMDSVVTPLTSQGAHLALDVRQALRSWKPSSGSGSNHGLVVQVEDQDGKPLKPSLYVQEPSCQLYPSASTPSPDASPDQKAYYFGPAIFIRTCSRYVRIVDDKVEMYVQCKPSQRH